MWHQVYINNKDFLENNNIKNTLNLMKRRGPDSQDFFQKITKIKILLYYIAD